MGTKRYPLPLIAFNFFSRVNIEQDEWCVIFLSFGVRLDIFMHYLSVPSLRMDTKNTTACRVPLHDSMPSFMNFRRVFNLLEFKNKASQCFAGNQRCPGV